MDECFLIPDVWTRIIALAPLEYAARISQVCRYLRDLVPTLGRVPRRWRNFITEERHTYVNGEGAQEEARFFVRELVRRGLHEVPGLTTYMSLTTDVSGKYIMGFSLVPHYVNRTASDGERHVKFAVELGLHFAISYRLCRRVPHHYKPVHHVPIKHDEPRWDTVVETWRTRLIGRGTATYDIHPKYHSLTDFFLNPENMIEWHEAKSWMAKQLLDFPGDTPYRA